MKKLIFAPLLLLGLALLPPVSHAQTQTPKSDVSLVEFLRNFIYTLEQPAYVYNWFNARGRDPIWKKHISAADNAGWDHFLSNTDRYWQGFCSKDPSLNPQDCKQVAPSDDNGGNMFGPGLYAAVDPVATLDYAGGRDGWVLMQIHLPQGLRIMDLRRDGNDALPLRLEKTFASYGCPTNWLDIQGGLNNMLSANVAYVSKNARLYSGAEAPHDLSPSCILEIRKVLKDDLKIDGFYYSYNGTKFKECDLPVDPKGGQVYSSDGGNNPARQGAFVLADSKQFTPSDIKVFNAQTSDETSDRIRIQSLFYKADADSDNARARKFYEDLSYPKYPNYKVSGVYSSCSFNGNNIQTCTWQVTLCPGGGGDCVNFEAPTPLPPYTTPSKMSGKNLPVSMSPLYGGQEGSKLLWENLEGTPPDASLGAWVTKNLFGCSADLQEDSTDD